MEHGFEQGIVYLSVTEFRRESSDWTETYYPDFIKKHQSIALC